jgi:hypothetical protein
MLSTTALSVLAYSFCSGTMLLINKLAIFHVGNPTMVSTMQLVATTIWCLGIKYSGALPVDDFEWSKVSAFHCQFSSSLLQLHFLALQAYTFTRLMQDLAVVLLCPCKE